MKIFNWQNVRLVLIFGIIGFLYSFTSKRNEARYLVKSEVVFTNDNNLFVTNDVVNKLLIENKNAARSIRKDKVDLNRLEKVINSHEMIEKSEVFVSIDGTLKAVVKQKTPIARVFEKTGSFYIDYKGNRMPLSNNFTARVPLLSGVTDVVKWNELVEILRTIHQDPFLKKNIVGVDVAEDGSVKMMNRNYDYVIDFGKPAEAEEKFRNYKAFLQKAASDSTIAHYKNINLRFTRQVVCTK